MGRGLGVSGEEEFFSCSFNYFNYAPGFCTGLMHMSARYSRARIRFSIRIYPYRMSKQVMANRWIGFAFSKKFIPQIRRKNSICPRLYDKLSIQKFEIDFIQLTHDENWIFIKFFFPFLFCI